MIMEAVETAGQRWCVRTGLKTGVNEICLAGTLVKMA
jgi:hypothetical protein